MSHQVVEVRREAVKPCITCPLCHKLFRDATTITECLHTFCRKCIYKNLSDEKSECCPICNIELGCVSLEKLRPDHNLQHVRENIFPQEKIKVKAPEEVIPVALPAKRKEISLSSLVASNELDGDALPLPQISTSYLKKKYHQPGLGGDKTKSAPAPISPLPSKVGKKDFSSSKGRKKYNFLPKDGKKDTTLSLSKKRSVPASAENAVGKKGKPSSPVMSPALESELASISVNSDTPPVPPTSSMPALTGSVAQTPRVGISEGSAACVSLLDMSPTSCYDFLRSFCTEKDKARLRGLSRREIQIALSYNMVQLLAFVVNFLGIDEAEEQTLVATKSKELAEANAKLQDMTKINSHHSQLLTQTLETVEALKGDKALLHDRIAIFEQEKINLKSTIANLQNQLKDCVAAHERQVADLNKQIHQLQEQVAEAKTCRYAEGIISTAPSSGAVETLADTTSAKETVTDLDEELKIELQEQVTKAKTRRYAEGIISTPPSSSAVETLADTTSAKETVTGLDPEWEIEFLKWDALFMSFVNEARGED